MNTLVKELMKRAYDASTLESAKAYLDATFMIMGQEGQEELKTIVLESYSEGCKIHIIKAMREQLGYSLSDAKNISEQTPWTFQPLSKSKAKQLIEALKLAGGNARLE